VVERYAYTPYGEMVVLDAAGAPKANQVPLQPYGYTGRRYDSETGLWYFRARYFDSELGRFVSRDPLKYIDGLSQYGGYFAPSLVDPYGLSCTLESVSFFRESVGSPWFVRSGTYKNPIASVQSTIERSLEFESSGQATVSVTGKMSSGASIGGWSAEVEVSSSLSATDKQSLKNSIKLAITISYHVDEVIDTIDTYLKFQKYIQEVWCCDYVGADSDWVYDDCPSEPVVEEGDDKCPYRVTYVWPAGTENVKVSSTDIVVGYELRRGDSHVIGRYSTEAAAVDGATADTARRISEYGEAGRRAVTGQ
jgi:RHS repeat-associated protein